MKIKLKAKYFKNCKFIDSRDCPIARAVKNDLQDAGFVSVSADSVYVKEKHYPLRNSYHILLYLWDKFIGYFIPGNWTVRTVEIVGL